MQGGRGGWAARRGWWQEERGEERERERESGRGDVGW